MLYIFFLFPIRLCFEKVVLIFWTARDIFNDLLKPLCADIGNKTVL